MIGVGAWSRPLASLSLLLSLTLIGCNRQPVMPPTQVSAVTTGFEGRAALLQGALRDVHADAIVKASDVIVIDSPGGRIAEAYALIADMKKRQTILVVPDDAYCQSACLLMMAAAETVFVGRNATFTLHAASRHGAYSERGTAMVRGYLRAHGWPADLIEDGVREGAERSFNGIEAVSRGLALGYACGTTIEPATIRMCEPSDFKISATTSPEPRASLPLPN